jgi:hypothetical protein
MDCLEHIDHVLPVHKFQRHICFHKGVAYQTPFLYKTCQHLWATLKIRVRLGDTYTFFCPGDLEHCVEQQGLPILKLHNNAPAQQVQLGALYIERVQKFQFAI